MDDTAKGRYIPTEGKTMEHRSARRVVPGEPLSVRLRPGGNAHVLDLSPRGGLLEVGLPLAIRSRVEVVFRSEQGEILVGATVRRCRVHGRKGDRLGEGSLLYRAALEFHRPVPKLLSVLGVEAGQRMGAGLRGRLAQGEPGS